jgi:1,4-dihydroxy-2-naphthoate polyprenyltransferase
MASAKSWIKAARLRTLPLAFASIGLGAFLATYDSGKFNWPVFATALLTTLFLQILSNLANDYGDFTNGADLAGRVGPSRTVQSGEISPQAMKKSLYIIGALSFLSGLSLLYLSGLLENMNVFGFFLLLGIAAIIASLKYTAGSNPYGYMGLGDLFVLIFFGWVGVLGTFYLMTATISFNLFLPATAFGFLATGVLNVNNMRDIESDQRAGKITIPVRLGLTKARIYHGFLIAFALIFTSLYICSRPGQSLLSWLFVLSIPLFIIHLKKIFQAKASVELDPLLKQLALSSMVFVLTFGIGLLLG